MEAKKAAGANPSKLKSNNRQNPSIQQNCGNFFMSICRVMEPLFCAPLSFGPLVLRPAEFWSNAKLAQQTHGDIVSGAKITTQKITITLHFWLT